MNLIKDISPVNSKSFVFKNVVLLKPFVFVLCFVVIMLLFFLAAAYFSRYIGLQLYLVVALGFGLLMLLFKGLSKTVIISFTDKDICLDINGARHVYPKTELKGFYSFNYAHTNNCMLVMDFHFNNGKVIYIYNYEFNAGKFNTDKHLLLTGFLKTAQNELGFKPVKTSKIRTRIKTANVWFAKA